VVRPRYPADVILSILTRKTRLRDRGQWEARLESVLPKIREVLAAENGFVSLQYLWGADEAGQTAQITAWKSLEDCRRYVREGAAATIATIEDAAVPTAAHPEGAWVRMTYEVAAGE